MVEGYHIYILYMEHTKKILVRKCVTKYFNIVKFVRNQM